MDMNGIETGCKKNVKREKRCKTTRNEKKNENTNTLYIHINCKTIVRQGRFDRIKCANGVLDLISPQWLDQYNCTLHYGRSQFFKYMYR